MVKLVIEKTIVTQFSDLRIALITGRGLNNSGPSDEIAAIQRSAAEAVQHHVSPETLLQHPLVLAWRETYRRFGTKPKDHRPTAESLLRRILRGEEIPSISKVVDLYLAAEAKFYLPIGGYDLDTIEGDISLRFSPGGEPFLPIGAANPQESTYAGEVIYADASKVLTRRWNYRDCEAAKITTESRNIALFCEAALPEIPSDQLRECTDWLAESLSRFCGGSIQTHFIVAANQSIQEL